jgi:hypothetical protein
MALFVHCRNNQEIIKELAAQNVFISEQEISYLGRKFVIYLALAHRESSKQLRHSMAKRGGLRVTGPVASKFLLYHGQIFFYRKT